MLLFLLVVLSCRGFGQENSDDAATDRQVLAIPASQTNSTSEIAAYITSHFDTDSKRVRAIYVWVVANIQYSTDSVHRIILDADRDQLVTVALRRRRGVCENFAAIFVDICQKCGLRAYVIEGYTRQGSNVDRAAHAWCTVYTGHRWRLYDPTWDASAAARPIPVPMSFFQADPSELIQTHMPFDPMFQLLDHPLTFKEFNDGGSHSGTRASLFDFDDSLEVYGQQRPLSRYLGIMSRMTHNGPANSLITNRLTQLKLEIEIIHQDSDSVLYNRAVGDYNEAVRQFNDFLAYRNNQFTPPKPPAEVLSAFTKIEELLADGRSQLRELGLSTSTLVTDFGDIEHAINVLGSHVKEQEAFFKNYQATSAGK